MFLGKKRQYHAMSEVAAAIVVTYNDALFSWDVIV